MVDKPIGAGAGAEQLFNGVLKRGHRLVVDPKDFKEVDPKRLGLRVFVRSIGPGFRKLQGVGFDLVPR